MKDRFGEKDFSIGQEAFLLLDESLKPPGIPYREWLAWEGPYKVIKVGPMHVVVDKDGEQTTVNKTRCVGIRRFEVPVRDANGRAFGDAPGDDEVQEALLREKVEYLKMKILRRESASLDEDSHHDSGMERKRLDRKVRMAPPRKFHFAPEDFKGGEMVVVYLKEKKGTYLARVLYVWTHSSDPTPWVRIHLYGCTSPGMESRKPYWLDGRRRVYQIKKATYTAMWEDIYATDILYRLQYPVADDLIDDRDKAEISRLWDNNLEILAIQHPRARL